MVKSISSILSLEFYHLVFKVQEEPSNKQVNCKYEASFIDMNQSQVLVYFTDLQRSIESIKQCL